MKDHTQSPGERLRDRLAMAREAKTALPMIGIYDVFSASLVAGRFDSVFLSGYGFAASHYGMPDEGYIAWSDMVDYASRVRHVLPQAHILVDIDDGYGDRRILLHTIRRLEEAGASAVMFEDQQRPKKCGHLPGKEIVPLDNYLDRLTALLAARKSMLVLARTDSSDLDDGLARVARFSQAGADAVMFEGIREHSYIPRIRKLIPPETFLAINLIRGGKTPPLTLDEAHALGADMVIFSTPCLFAAHSAINKEIEALARTNGLLVEGSGVNLDENLRVLKRNQERSE